MNSVEKYRFLIITLCSLIFSAVAVIEDLPENYQFEVEQIETNVYDDEFIEFFSALRIPFDSPIEFNEYEVSILKNTDDDNDVNYDEKEWVFRKFQTKIESLKCTNTLIIMAIKNDINNTMVDDEGYPIVDQTERFVDYRNVLENMMSVLYYGRIKANSWVIDMYMRLFRATRPYRMKMVVKPKFFEDDNYKDKLMAHFEQCQNNQFLKNMNDEEGAYYEQNWVPTIIEELYKNPLMNNAYDIKSIFVQQNLLLYFLANKLDVILGNTFHYAATERHINLMKLNLRMCYRYNTWLNPNYYFLSLHSIVQRLVYTNVLHHVLIHLQIFQNSKSSNENVVFTNTSETSDDTTDCYQHLWRSILTPLRDSMDLLFAEDSLLSSIFDFISNDSPRSPKLKLLEFNARFTHSRLMQALEENNSTQLVHLSLDSDDSIESKIEFVQNEIQQNSISFTKYVENVQQLLNPIGGNLFFVKFLSDDILTMKCSPPFPFSDN